MQASWRPPPGGIPTQTENKGRTSEANFQVIAVMFCVEIKGAEFPQGHEVVNLETVPEKRSDSDFLQKEIANFYTLKRMSFPLLILRDCKTSL